MSVIFEFWVTWKGSCRTGESERAVHSYEEVLLTQVRPAVIEDQSLIVDFQKQMASETENVDLG